MKQTKQIIKELALIVGFALGIFLVLTLIAGVRSLLGGSLWRLSAFVGAIIWLLAAVFLLSGRLGRQKMKLWTEHFPHIRFVWALVLIGTVLILLACGLSYFVI